MDLSIGLGHGFTDDINLISCSMIMMYHQIDIGKYTSVKSDSNSKLSSKKTQLKM